MAEHVAPRSAFAQLAAAASSQPVDQAPRETCECVPHLFLLDRAELVAAFAAWISIFFATPPHFCSFYSPLALAVEQEMRARTQEMRAKVVEAEALVPQAMAEAFRSGHLGIMDYYRMKNVQADTSMRESIAGTDKPRTEGT